MHSVKLSCADSAEFKTRGIPLKKKIDGCFGGYYFITETPRCVNRFDKNRFFHNLLDVFDVFFVLSQF